jgi:hypothetical protein
LPLSSAGIASFSCLTKWGQNERSNRNAPVLVSELSNPIKRALWMMKQEQIESDL